MTDAPADERPDGIAQRVLDDGTPEHLLREEPLVLDVGGDTLVTMRTPGDDEHLAVGFLLSEGVIRTAASVTDCQFTPGDAAAGTADTLHVRLEGHTGDREPRTGRLTRTHEIRSSCGLCGLANLDDLLDDLPPLLPALPRLTPAAIAAIRDHLVDQQTHFRTTGASHAAAICGEQGTLLALGEDVGRHNALDKAIGRAARGGAELARCVAMLSGRAGFDLVLKCLRVRIPVILSVSAASAQSFDLCQSAGATLVGFVRPDRQRVYLSGGRLGS
ncbi:MAG: formate dehydrogenase accessory sulfurtransferase FdhD [Planctomycetota bacterium]